MADASEATTQPAKPRPKKNVRDPNKKTASQIAAEKGRYDEPRKYDYINH